MLSKCICFLGVYILLWVQWCFGIPGGRLLTLCSWLRLFATKQIYLFYCNLVSKVIIDAFWTLFRLTADLSDHWEQKWCPVSSVTSPGKNTFILQLNFYQLLVRCSEYFIATVKLLLLFFLPLLIFRKTHCVPNFLCIVFYNTKWLFVVHFLIAKFKDQTGSIWLHYLRFAEFILKAF